MNDANHYKVIEIPSENLSISPAMLVAICMESLTENTSDGSYRATNRPLVLIQH